MLSHLISFVEKFIQPFEFNLLQTEQSFVLNTLLSELHCSPSGFMFLMLIDEKYVPEEKNISIMFQQRTIKNEKGRKIFHIIANSS